MAAAEARWTGGCEREADCLVQARELGGQQLVLHPSWHQLNERVLPAYDLTGDACHTCH